MQNIQQQPGDANPKFSKMDSAYSSSSQPYAKKKAADHYLKKKDSTKVEDRTAGDFMQMNVDLEAKSSDYGK